MPRHLPERRPRARGDRGDRWRGPHDEANRRRPRRAADAGRRHLRGPGGRQPRRVPDPGAAGRGSGRRGHQRRRRGDVRPCERGGGVRPGRRRRRGRGHRWRQHRDPPVQRRDRLAGGLDEHRGGAADRGGGRHQPRTPARAARTHHPRAPQGPPRTSAAGAVDHDRHRRNIHRHRRDAAVATRRRLGRRGTRPGQPPGRTPAPGRRAAAAGAAQPHERPRTTGGPGAQPPTAPTSSSPASRSPTR